MKSVESAVGGDKTEQVVKEESGGERFYWDRNVGKR